ncbi:MAG: hypothetical protein KDK39_16145 [Leptospiraceae bacterium]|nr:hypothetical protein [Leptospiraceae bacterium]
MTATEILLGKIGIFWLQFLIVALVLQLVAQTMHQLPYLGKYLGRPWGHLIVLVLLWALAGVLVFYLPGLRVLHQTGLIQKVENQLWLDIVLSALALSRLTWLWQVLFRWLDRKTSG